MSSRENKREESEDRRYSELHGIQSERMQTDDFVMETESSSPIPEECYISEIEMKTEEEEQNFRSQMTENEIKFLANLYEEQRKNLEDMMKSQFQDGNRLSLKEQYEKTNQYVENLEQDYIGIKERLISHETKFLAIKKQDEEIARLSKEIKKKEEINAIKEAEKIKKVAILEQIRKRKEEIKTYIALYKNRLEIFREKESKFHEVRAELEEKERELFESKKGTEELMEKIKSVDEARKTSREKHEKEIQEKRMEIEKLNVEVINKKKKRKEIEEMQDWIKLFEQQALTEMNDRQKRQEEEKEELKKEKEKLKSLEEKFEAIETKRKANCKASEFVSFKGKKVGEIKNEIAKRQKEVSVKEIEVKKCEEEFEKLKREQEEKEIKLKEVTKLLEAERIKSAKNKKILEEVNQQIILVHERIEEQEKEKQENLQRKDEICVRKRELEDREKELQTKITEKDTEIEMVKDLNKDALEVNEQIKFTFKAQESLNSEISKYQKEHEAKIAEIESRIVQKSKKYEKRISDLESEVQKRDKVHAEKKRREIKQEEENMKQERRLRENLAKLTQEIAALDENIETDLTTEINAQKIRKSILKSPLPQRAPISQAKSPRKVKFDIESESSSSAS